jgi:type I restriction enzyme R subunit
LAERGDGTEAAVVMTVNPGAKGEPADWARYELTPEAQDALVRRLNNVDDPLRFLIVTAKLLTGFDAPIEGVLYLDKPLRLHTLFQAICRTNRRWTNPRTGQEKYYSLVVDYVGIGEEIARSLRDADPEHGGRRPVDVSGLLSELQAALDTALARFDGIDRGDTSFAALRAAQERIPRGEARDAFAADFTRVESLWEFLWPNADLDPRRGDYRWLAQIYESVKPSQVSNALLWQRLGAKTFALVHSHITDLKVTGTGLDEVIVDEVAIEVIRQLTLPGTGGEPAGDGNGPITVGEALDTIEARIRRRLRTSGDHDVFVALSDRLERLRRAQLDKASASVEFLRELLDLAQQVTAAEQADDEGRLDLPGLLPDPHIGALTQILEEYRPPNVPVIIEEVVAAIDEVVRQVRFTGWNETQAGDRTVRRELRLLLKRYGLPTTRDLFDRAYAYIRENY